MNDRMLLFIPAYNCEKQIVRVLHQLDEEVVPYFEEILVVNNRSTDHTEQVVMEYLAEHPSLPVKLMRNDDNYGLAVRRRWHSIMQWSMVMIMSACCTETIRETSMILSRCWIRRSIRSMIVYWVPDL